MGVSLDGPEEESRGRSHGRHERVVVGQLDDAGGRDACMQCNAGHATNSDPTWLGQTGWTGRGARRGLHFANKWLVNYRQRRLGCFLVIRSSARARARGGAFLPAGR